MSQGNKKITRKVVVVNNKIWVCSSSLMQPVFFKEIPATNYKFWSLLVSLHKAVQLIFTVI